MRVKICGITNSKDAVAAAKAGATAVGFIFYKKSPRCVSPFKVQKIMAELPPLVTPVGVFVNQKEGAVKEIAQFTGIRTLQFHGDETPAYCRRFKGYHIIKALRVSGKVSLETLKLYKVAAFLFDTYKDDRYGGTGDVFDWSLLKGVKNQQIPVILSGGLDSGNVGAAVETVKPYAVDVSSGVETSPGVKDHRLIRQFIDAANFAAGPDSPP